VVFRQWRKLHIGIDAESLQIRSVRLTKNNVSDSQVLGDLLNQILQAEPIDSSQKNARPWKNTKFHSLERNELLRTVKHLGTTK